MRLILQVFALVFLASYLAIAADTMHELQMSLADRFIVSESEKWNVEVEKVLSFRFADVRITPKTDSSFSLMLYFKCDTSDLSQFDTAHKIENSVRLSSENYLPYITEKKIEIKQLNPKGWYGCYTILTDKQLASTDNVPNGEFKYITRGMIRLSPDSALGFSLMTNTLNSPQYNELIDYICSFAKDK